ncbi:MAG: MCE family protein [Solirubrobacterales bacterium]|nr:MCE family protein [Solirubrobacterales bacterium]
MRRIALCVLICVAAIASVTLVASAGASDPTGFYKIELDNAFGLVNGAQVKVAGVPAGSIKSIDLDQSSHRALVSIQLSQRGFQNFHSDAFCQSRPQSLIGEYFIDCQPGQAGNTLAPGTTLPVTQTQSTIPADLLLDVMRLPVRQRLTLIINELGAAAAGRSGDLEAALRRAVPALTETDNLLALLARDSNTLQQLTQSADTVVTALSNNRAQVQRFITEAGNTASATATQQAALRSSLQQLPGFLAQLRPALADLSVTTQANLPVLSNLNASAAQLDRLLRNLPPFFRAALPAIQSLGRTSTVGKPAVQAAEPTVALLNKFAAPTPELAQNLAIVLHDLDNRGRAVEADPRSPGGKGYTGLEALLQYVFNQTLAINLFGPFGHVLAVDSFVDPQCSPYATPATIALSLKKFGPSYRHCYAWLGPQQPGVNTTDPSNPRACVPDPGGAPPGERGPKTTACKLEPGTRPASDAKAAATGSASAGAASAGAASAGAAPAGAASAGGTSAAGAGGSGPSGSGAQTASSKSSGGGQARQLLNYLLSP